jgi:hypothetical protein
MWQPHLKYLWNPPPISMKKTSRPVWRRSSLDIGDGSGMVAERIGDGGCWRLLVRACGRDGQCCECGFEDDEQFLVIRRAACRLK